jgi:hypothetical protein
VPLIVHGQPFAEDEEDVEQMRGRKPSTASVGLKKLSPPVQSHSRNGTTGLSPGGSNEAFSVQGSAVSVKEQV